MEITDVVERVLAGDKQAFEKVVTEYQGPLFGYLGRMGLPEARAEEVAQETFLRVWTHLASFDAKRASFSTWLYTIARRLALNALSRQATRRELAASEGREAADDTPEPPQALAVAERARALKAALRKLPAHERTVIALAYTRDLALVEVAQIEGCSVGAVKTRLHRARKRLAILLENNLE